MKKLIVLLILLGAGTSHALIDNSLTSGSFPSYQTLHSVTSAGIGTNGGAASAGIDVMAISEVVLYKTAGYISCPTLTPQSNAYTISAISGSTGLVSGFYKDGYTTFITTSGAVAYNGGLGVVTGTTNWNGTYSVLSAASTSVNLLNLGNAPCTGSGTAGGSSPASWCTGAGAGTYLTALPAGESAGTLTFGSAWSQPSGSPVGPVTDQSTGDFCAYVFVAPNGTGTGGQTVTWSGAADTVWVASWNVENVAQTGTGLDGALASANGTGYTITTPTITTTVPGDDVLTLMFSMTKPGGAAPGDIGILTGDVNGNLNAAGTSSIQTPSFNYYSNTPNTVLPVLLGNSIVESTFPFGASEVWGQPAQTEGAETIKQTWIVAIVGSITLPQATITVTGASSGIIGAFPNGAGTYSIGPDTVTCTGVSGNNLTGCSGGTHTITGGTPIIRTNGSGDNNWIAIRVALKPQFALPTEAVGSLTPGQGNFTDLSAGPVGPYVPGEVFLQDVNDVGTNVVVSSGNSATSGFFLSKSNSPFTNHWSLKETVGAAQQQGALKLHDEVANADIFSAATSTDVITFPLTTNLVAVQANGTAGIVGESLIQGGSSVSWQDHLSPIGSANATVSTSVANVFPISGLGTPVATTSRGTVEQLVSNGLVGTAHILSCYLTDATGTITAAGGTKYTVALEMDGSATTLTCDITTALTHCADVTHTVSLSGTLLDYVITPVGTPTALIPHCTMSMN